MKYDNSVCIDASAALAAVLQNDPNHKAAVAHLAQLAAQNKRLCAPALFTYECDSVIRLNMYRGTLTEEEAKTALFLLDVLGIDIEYSPLDHRRAFEIATLYLQPRAYDAAYAAHAEARGIDLLTTDEPFFEALNGSKRPKSVPSLAFVKLIK